jgi:hypothetical protein
MKTRSGSFVGLFLTLLLLSLVACTQPVVPQPDTLPTEAPPAVGATPLPASAQMLIGDFADRQQAIDEEWDQIHADFDQWRADLTSCDPNSMRAALNDFAVAFNEVTEHARSLTRTQTTGEMADTLIAAAEGEEAAFRRLRDHWQPNNVSLFENLEQQRSRASQAQKNAEDQAIKFRISFEDGADPDAAEDFAQSFDPIKDDWAAIHDEYAELRDNAETVEVDAVFTELDALVARIAIVVDAVDELPSVNGAESAVDALKDAGEAEVAAFTVTAEPADAPLLPDFSAMDASVEETNDALQDTHRALTSQSDANPEEGLADLQVFNSEYPRLVSAWNAFHRRYNDWRESDGGCDRTEVSGALNQFSFRFGSLARDVRDLPRAGFLLSIYTSLAEAAGREENAFRSLSNSWQPFTVDPFRGVDQQRVNADGLRREADIALQELSNRF